MRVVPIALVFLVGLPLAALSGGPVESAPKEMKPKKAYMKRSVLSEPRPFNYALPEGKTASASQTALSGKVANRKLTLVDVDGDGRFDEDGVDGWSLGNYLYLLPFEQPMIFGNILVHIEVDAKKKTLMWRASHMKKRGAGWHELARINGIRMRNGIPPASYSAELSKACRAHCKYMEQHGMGHHEDPSLPGYTDEGARAGENSNIALGYMVAGVGAFRQFYHRRTVSDPYTREMGFGLGRRYSCVDGMSSREPRPWKWPLIIPAPDSTHHTISFDHGESPAPVPPAPPAGMPITLRWPRGTTITGAKAGVFDSKDKKLRVSVSSPEKPANEAVPTNNDSICIIPRVVLKPGANIPGGGGGRDRRQAVRAHLPVRDQQARQEVADPTGIIPDRRAAPARCRSTEGDPSIVVVPESRRNRDEMPGGRTARALRAHVHGTGCTRGDRRDRRRVRRARPGSGLGRVVRRRHGLEQFVQRWGRSRSMTSTTSRRANGAWASSRGIHRVSRTSS